MNTAAIPCRRCLSCSAVEPIAGSEAVWPAGWQCSACGCVVAQSDGISMLAPELADTISGMDPQGFETLSDVETEHFWFVARNELLVGLANKFFPHARRFLEIGCGTGAVLNAMAASRSWVRLVGSELHPSGLAFARRRLAREAEFVQMDARNIPATNVFDLTGAFDVIEHIADDEAVLRGLRTATQTGGGTIIAVPQHPWLWSRTDEVAYHQRRYGRGELETKLRRSGFEILFSSSYTALLLPLMMASRAMGRGQQSSVDVNREFTLDRRTNGLLTWVLRAEVRMTLAGMKWPAGGSRIVVARAL